MSFRPTPLADRPRWRYALALAFSLAALSAAAGLAQPAPTPDVASFVHGLTGDWVGTFEQTTNGEKADIKYFHAVARPCDQDTYQITFDYYRLDPQTGATLPIGTSAMTTKLAADGTATNTVTGKGCVMVDSTTSKPEEHALTEVLQKAASGQIEGSGGGSIKVSGLPMGAGKNGRVQSYHSTWTRDGDVLTISQQLRLKFKLLMLGKSFDIACKLTARPGKSIAEIMRPTRG